MSILEKLSQYVDNMNQLKLIQMIHDQYDFEKKMDFNIINKL